jgi:uncharacterized protein (TIGR02453 family)
LNNILNPAFITIGQGNQMLSSVSLPHTSCIGESMFQGFSQSGFQFLKQLKENNSKDWFEERRALYEQSLRNPAKALIEQMDELFLQEELPFEASLKKSLFRIHRDTRFSKDKSPYKANIGITFPIIRDGMPKEAKTEIPGIYLHIEPKACFIAGGLYMPDATQLKSLRTRIEEDWNILDEIHSSSDFLKEFPEGVQGAKVKTMPRGYDPEHPGKEWLRMKQFIVMDMISDKITQSDKLVEMILKKAHAITPFMQFLEESVRDY